MADEFENFQANLFSPIEQTEPVVPGTPFTNASRSLWIGTGGDVEITTVKGTTDIWENVPDGTLLPVRAIEVVAAGTTATGIIALS